MTIYSRPATPQYCNNFDATFPKVKKPRKQKYYVQFRDITYTKKEWDVYELLAKHGWLRRASGVKKRGMKVTPGDRWEPVVTATYPLVKESTRTYFINRLIKKGVAVLNEHNPNEVYLTMLAKAVGLKGVDKP